MVALAPRAEGIIDTVHPSTKLPFICEKELDRDQDGVGDSFDFCPNTPKLTYGVRTHVDDNGCSKNQVDPDGDGVCSMIASLPHALLLVSRFCARSVATGQVLVDNCPLTWNPSQEHRFHPVVGDACTTSKFACKD